MHCLTYVKSATCWLCKDTPSQLWLSEEVIVCIVPASWPTEITILICELTAMIIRGIDFVLCKHPRRGGMRTSYTIQTSLLLFSEDDIAM
jgi:hypothetical protein